MASWRGTSYGNAYGFGNGNMSAYVYVTVPAGATAATISAATGYVYPGEPWNFQLKTNGSWANIPFTGGSATVTPGEYRFALTQGYCPGYAWCINESSAIDDIQLTYSL